MQIGDSIPENLGIDQDGNEIKSSDYRGRKIVLYSYPKANTSGCTAEACSLQAHKEELLVPTPRVGGLKLPPITTILLFSFVISFNHFIII